MLKDCFLSGDWFIIIALHQGPKSTLTKLDILLIVFWNMGASKKKDGLFLQFSTHILIVRRSTSIDHTSLFIFNEVHIHAFILYHTENSSMYMLVEKIEKGAYVGIQCLLFSFVIVFEKGLFIGKSVLNLFLLFLIHLANMWCLNWLCSSSESRFAMNREKIELQDCLKCYGKGYVPNFSPFA